ncbi:MAG: AI-2E family transporter [Bdellovibrionales bacterium]|jgi:predicted PurR-regulated permease PerM|nr:AI-2E family transporter [Bdellovibrionales bacterium]
MADWTTKPLRDRLRTVKKMEKIGSGDWMLRFTLLVTIVALIWMNIGFVKPLAMAALFAATLNPLLERMESKIKSLHLRAALLTGGFTVVFLVPLGIVAFLAADAGLKRLKGMPEDWTGQLPIESLLHRLEDFLPFERAEIMRVLEQGVTTVGKTALGVLQNLVADLPKLTVDNIVVVLGMYVFMVERQAVMNWLRRFSPLSEAKTDRLFGVVGGLSSSVIFAALASGFVQSMIIGLVLVIMGYPGTLLITMTAFVLSFVPVVGTAPVTIYLIGAAVLTGNWPQAIGFVVMAGVVGVSDNFVRPYVLSGSAKLHPLVGFIAAFGALETIGFYGLFLGPVVAGAVFTLVELVLDEKAA